MDFRVRSFRKDLVSPPEDISALPWPDSFRPLDLEIGCGVGWHPIAYATENPDRRLIAIEHTRAKFERFQSRLTFHPELKNLFSVHGDAVRWVANTLSPETIERCFILYPNPEPKAPNKRWLRSPFMHRLLEVIKPGGEIHLATNEKWYWEEAITWGREAWNLALLRAGPVQSSPRTHFEKKYLSRGETCFDLILRKP